MYYEIVRAQGGYRAHIRGENNRLVWWTEVYESKSGATNAIDMVKSAFGAGEVKDET